MTPKAIWPVQGRSPRQSELQGSLPRGLGGVLALADLTP